MEKDGKKKEMHNSLTVKKRGPFHLVRAALFMIKRGCGSKNKSVPVNVVEKGVWKKLICAMRPLHHHNLQNSPPKLRIMASPDSFHDVPLPPPSPPSHVQRVYEDGMSSRYASAEDLQNLDTNDENAGCNTGDFGGVVVVDDITDDEDDHEAGSPNAIDMQAEEFIAKFYEQMKLQRMESMD